MTDLLVGAATRARAPRLPATALAVLSLLATGAAQAATAAPAPQSGFNGADTAWMLVSTVLVFLMTMPGIMLFYSGMLRKRNALSIMAQTMAAIGVITFLWAAVGYSVAFDSGSPWFGGLDKAWAAGLIGQATAGHPIAPHIPEAVFFLFQMSFAIIAFAVVLGATAERMRIGATIVFAAFWLVLVYAPVAHWIWHPEGWLARLGHLDFAGGTVVHIVAGASGLAAAIAAGPAAWVRSGAHGAAQPRAHRDGSGSAVGGLVRVQRGVCLRGRTTRGRRAAGHAGGGRHRRLGLGSV
jgi:ammonium transporter, Amt family